MCSPAAALLAEHRMAGTCTAAPRGHGRLACAEAMSAAISSPFTSSASSHCIWCTRRTRLVPRIRSLALRTSAEPTPHPDRGHRRRCDHLRCYRCLQRRQSGVQLVQPQLESALVIAEWPASKPEPLRCARQRHLPCSSCQSTAWQAQPASTATADWRVPRPRGRR